MTILKNKNLEVDFLLEKCDKFISAIYRLEEVNKKTKKLEHILWKISSDKLTSKQHFNNSEEFIFQGDSLRNALSEFYDFLKKKKKI